MKKQVLWIEDSALGDVSELATPVLMTGKHDLVISVDVSDGISKLMEREFDAVIVDIRLPPGQDAMWEDEYKKHGRDKIVAKLGVKMLKWLLRKEAGASGLELSVSWLEASRIGVLTVEPYSELAGIMDELGIGQDRFVMKTADMVPGSLLDLIDAVIGE